MSTPLAPSAPPAAGSASASRWAGRGALANAVIEAWHSTLEFELRSVQHFATRAAARAAVAAWIDDYNRHRRHSALQMMSPADYEQALRSRGQAA
ncbi:MAG TPA: integrase core domain-containing protein [Streptosporangiaceae bacterium]|nr:integrase core domain-containing protein [Streptosporangiaceae bacterium]